MAFAQSISGFIAYPILDTLRAAAPNINGSVQTLDSANESVAMVFMSPVTATLSKIGFRVGGAVTTGADLDIRVETVGTGGFPSGTLWNTSSNGIQQVNENSANSYFTVTLGSGATLNIGSFVAIRIQMSATSAGNLRIDRITNFADTTATPYTLSFAANSWIKSGNSLPMGLELSDGNYIPNGYLSSIPVTLFGQTTYSTNSSPDEKGIAFSVPFPCTATGCWGNFATTISANIILYDTDGTTVLRTILMGSSNQGVTTMHKTIFPFLSPVSFVTQGTYRLTLVGAASGNVTILELIGSSSIVNSSYDGYPYITSTQRTDSGSWVESTTSRTTMGLLLSQFDNGVQLKETGGVWGF